MRALAVLAALALAGCNAPAPSGLGERLSGLTGAAPRPAGASDAAEVQRLLAAGAPLMAYALPGHGISTTMVGVSSRGGVQVWRSLDNIQIHSEGGVILATRGLGFDLIASSVEGAAQDAAAQSAAAVILSGRLGRLRRSWRHLDGEGRLIARDWDCEIRPAGAQDLPPPRGMPRLEGFRGLRIEEHCQGAAGRFTNLYWLGEGRIRQSVQYVGADLGRIETRFLGPQERARAVSNPAPAEETTHSGLWR